MLGRKFGESLNEDGIKLVDYGKMDEKETFYYTVDLSDGRIRIVSFQIVFRFNDYRLLEDNIIEENDVLTILKVNELTNKIKRKIEEITRIRKIFKND